MRARFDNFPHLEGMPKMIIGSMPRSGTYYTTLLFRTLGVSCQHEGLRPQDITKIKLPYVPKQTVDVNGWSSFFMNNLFINKNLRFIYQVRNPLKVLKNTIWSWYPRNVKAADAIRAHYKSMHYALFGSDFQQSASVTMEKSFLESAARLIFHSYEYGWHNAEFAYKIECIDGVFPQIMEMLNRRRSSDEYEAAFKMINKETNSFKDSRQSTDWHQQLTWSDVPSYLRDLAREMGYNVQ